MKIAKLAAYNRSANQGGYSRGMQKLLYGLENFNYRLLTDKKVMENARHVLETDIKNVIRKIIEETGHRLEKMVKASKDKMLDLLKKAEQDLSRDQQEQSSVPRFTQT